MDAVGGGPGENADRRVVHHLHGVIREGNVAVGTAEHDGRGDESETQTVGILARDVEVPPTAQRLRHAIQSRREADARGAVRGDEGQLIFFAGERDSLIHVEAIPRFLDGPLNHREFTGGERHLDGIDTETIRRHAKGETCLVSTDGVACVKTHGRHVGWHRNVQGRVYP